jgi:hypothetical protein
MTIEQTPATARTDVRRSAAVSGTTRPTRPFLLHGTVLTVGAVSWAITQAVNGIDPHGATEEAIYSLTSGIFQVGLLCLLRVLWRTQALGEGRVARFFIRLVFGMVVLAIGSTIADGISVSNLDQAGWLMLDMFWPLSMIGMFGIGIRIAIAGRWHGAARFWPMVAESWAVVCVPTMGIFGEDVATVVSFFHLCLGYGVLGQIVARKEA